METRLLYNNKDHGEKRTVLIRLIQKYARSKDVNKLYLKSEEWMSKIRHERSKIIGNYAGAWDL
ncbi:MAG: hypothetical protein GX327_08655 [Epulopiscium sp.]|nr:hypothetical protein [Candidatus Epulonipiscium sp.]